MYINDVYINNKLYICISKGRKDMRNTPEDKNKLKINIMNTNKKSVTKLQGKTYDVHFNDDENSNNKGFKSSLAYCKDWITTHMGSNHSYFEDYKGGTVSIVCNETGESVFETEVI